MKQRVSFNGHADDNGNSYRETLHPLERQALEAVGQSDDPVHADPEEVRALVQGEGYRPSLGSPLSACHYRRSLSNGACLHLVVEGKEGRLHCDRFDPHRDPYSFVLHLLTEAPRETLANLAAGWALLRFLVR
jgi:hypothetical protein